MNKCVNCDYTTENDEKFCPNCGGEIVVDAPAAEVVGAENNSSKTKSIIGMILSAVGMGFSLISFGNLLNAIIAIVLGAVGSHLSKKAASEGDVSTLTRLGKIFGKIAIIVAIVALVITIGFFVVYLLLYGGAAVLGLVAAIVTGTPMFG